MDINVTVLENSTNVIGLTTPIEVFASQVGIQGIQGPSGFNGGGNSVIVSGLITSGEVYLISGELSNRLGLTGTVLFNLINNISSNTGNFITNNNLQGLISTGAADLLYLHSGSSGQFYSISNPNQYIKSGDSDNKYSTILNLNLTGFNSLQRDITLSGLIQTTGTNLQNQIILINNNTGNFYTKDNPNNFIRSGDIVSQNISNPITGLGNSLFIPKFGTDGSGLINSNIIDSGNVIVFNLPINGTGLLSGMKIAIPRGTLGNFAIQDAFATGQGLVFTANNNLVYGSIYSSSPTFTIQGSDRSVILNPNGPANGLAVNGWLDLQKTPPISIRITNANGATIYGTINIQNDNTKSLLINSTGNILLSGSNVGINCFPISALDVSGTITSSGLNTPNWSVDPNGNVRQTGNLILGNSTTNSCISGVSNIVAGRNNTLLLQTLNGNVGISPIGGNINLYTNTAFTNNTSRLYFRNFSNLSLGDVDSQTLRLTAENFQITGNTFISGNLNINGSLNIVPVLSSGNNINLGSNSFYIHTGYSVDTWILPNLSNSIGRIYNIKNKGNSIILTGASSTERLFSTSEVLTFTINSGEACRIQNDSQHWCII